MESGSMGGGIRSRLAGEGGGSRLPATRARNARLRLLDSAVGLVEDLRRDGGALESPAPEHCAAHQVCLPYRGVFLWHVGGDEVVGDPNQVVYVRAGEASRVRGPLAEGYAELILTPAAALLAELAGCDGGRLARHALFRRRARRSGPELQRRAAQLRHRLASGRMERLEAEESVITILRAALHDDAPRERPGSETTRRIVRRAKEYLGAELGGRILLADVGRAAGASPAYLTDLFRRVEGVSLHRYLTQLRLARALEELPHAADLTALALELGFSSHSHFSAAFRRAFGATPSAVRASSRRGAARAVSRADRTYLPETAVAV